MASTPKAKSAKSSSIGARIKQFLKRTTGRNQKTQQQPQQQQQQQQQQHAQLQHQSLDQNGDKKKSGIPKRVQSCRETCVTDSDRSRQILGSGGVKVKTTTARVASFTDTTPNSRLSDKRGTSTARAFDNSCKTHFSALPALTAGKADGCDPNRTSNRQTLSDFRRLEISNKRVPPRNSSSAIPGFYSKKPGWLAIKDCPCTNTGTQTSTSEASRESTLSGASTRSRGVITPQRQRFSGIRTSPLAKRGSAASASSSSSRHTWTAQSSPKPLDPLSKVLYVAEIGICTDTDPDEFNSPAVLQGQEGSSTPQVQNVGSDISRNINSELLRVHNVTDNTVVATSECKTCSIWRDPAGIAPGTQQRSGLLAAKASDNAPLSKASLLSNSSSFSKECATKGKLPDVIQNSGLEMAVNSPTTPSAPCPAAQHKKDIYKPIYRSFRDSGMDVSGNKPCRWKPPKQIISEGLTRDSSPSGSPPSNPTRDAHANRDNAPVSAAANRKPMHAPPKPRQKKCTDKPRDKSSTVRKSTGASSFRCSENKLKARDSLSGDSERSSFGTSSARNSGYDLSASSSSDDDEALLNNTAREISSSAIVARPKSPTKVTDLLVKTRSHQTPAQRTQQPSYIRHSRAIRGTSTELCLDYSSDGSDTSDDDNANNLASSKPRFRSRYSGHPHMITARDFPQRKLGMLQCSSVSLDAKSGASNYASVRTPLQRPSTVDSGTQTRNNSSPGLLDGNNNQRGRPPRPRSLRSSSSSPAGGVRAPPLRPPKLFTTTISRSTNTASSPSLMRPNSTGSESDVLRSSGHYDPVYSRSRSSSPGSKATSTSRFSRTSVRHRNNSRTPSPRSGTPDGSPCKGECCVSPTRGASPSQRLYTSHGSISMTTSSKRGSLVNPSCSRGVSSSASSKPSHSEGCSRRTDDPKSSTLSQIPYRVPWTRNPSSKSGIPTFNFDAHLYRSMPQTLSKCGGGGGGGGKTTESKSVSGKSSGSGLLPARPAAYRRCSCTVTLSAQSSPKICSWCKARNASKTASSSSTSSIGFKPVAPPRRKRLPLTKGCRTPDGATAQGKDIRRDPEGLCEGPSTSFCEGGVVVANFGPADYNYDESISTLRYANRAKNIKNRARVNEDPKDALLRQFQEEIEALRKQLEEGGGELGSGESGSETDEEDDGTGSPKKRRRRKSKGVSKEKMAEIQSQIESDRRKLEKSKDMAEEEKRKVEENLAEKEQELQKAEEEQQQLQHRLSAIEKKIIVGGENLLEKAEEQERLLEESAKELEERNRKAEQLKKALEEKEQERLDIEEKYSSKQEEIAGKTRKLKKVWTMLLQAKSEIADLQQEHQREMEGLLENVRQLSRELRLQMLIIDSFIPPQYQEMIEQYVHWNEDIGEWQLKCVAYTGNNMRKQTPLPDKTKQQTTDPDLSHVYLAYTAEGAEEAMKGAKGGKGKSGKQKASSRPKTSKKKQRDVDAEA